MKLQFSYKILHVPLLKQLLALRRLVGQNIEAHEKPERRQAAVATGFDALLDPGELRSFGVGAGTVADVFARIVMAAPDGVPQVDIASGITLPGLAELPQGSVSRAAALLLKLGLLTRMDRRVERPGRPIIPLSLGPGWALIGVRIENHRGGPAEVAGALAPLDGTRIDKRFSVALNGTEDHEALVKTIASVVNTLTKDDTRQVLGVGVELAGHVHQGSVMVPASPGGSFPLGERLSKALSGRATVVENELNARAAMEIWRKDRGSGELCFPQPHFMVVAVFDERVDGALVIDRKVYRGMHGMAGEIGHLTVDHGRPRRKAPSRPGSAASDAKSFDDHCHCADGSAAGTRTGPRGYGHVNALATPTRIAGELGIDISQFSNAAQDPGTDQAGQVTLAGQAFRTAGEALGRGIAAMLNIANPGNLLLLLPPELAQPDIGTAAAQYTQAIEDALDNEGFSTAAADARAGQQTLRIEALDPSDPDDPLYGARAARVSVLDSFIAHARGEDTESLAKTTNAD